MAISSDEVEYRSIAQGVCEVLWLKRVLNELKRPISFLIKLYCDNKAVISITYNPVLHNRTKHVDIDTLYNR